MKINIIKKGDKYPIILLCRAEELIIDAVREKITIMYPHNQPTETFTFIECGEAKWKTLNTGYLELCVDIFVGSRIEPESEGGQCRVPV